MGSNYDEKARLPDQQIFLRGGFWKHFSPRFDHDENRFVESF